MAEEPKTNPVVAKCRRCGNLLSTTFSSDERSRSTVKCGKCGTENTLETRTSKEETRMKRERVSPRQV